MSHSHIKSQYTVHQTHRDVTSTARLFNFTRPVYITNSVWDDCVDIVQQKSITDELSTLQRLRHLLFMAASALHGRIEDLEMTFRIYRIPNKTESGLRKPEEVKLHLTAHKNEKDMPVITIKFPDE